MVHLLLIIIYLSFISLGLPDALLGAAWPTIYQDLGVPMARAGILSMLIAAGTILSSLFSDTLNRRLGTGKVVTLSAALTTGAMLGFSLSRSFPLLCLWTIPYGVGAGSVDAALNNYVAIHYKSRHMNWLHCMWGIGASIGPNIMGWALAGGSWSWMGGYRTVGLMQLALTAVLVLSLPLWSGGGGQGEAAPAGEPMSPEKALGIPGVVWICAALLFYCALEQTTGLWAGSYLVFHGGFTPQRAAKLSSLYFLGITAGRGLAGFLSFRLGDTQMIRLGEGVLLAGVIALLVPGGALPGLLLTGLGSAPLFPCMIHSTPRLFGAGRSQGIIGVEMAAAYLGTCLMPPLFGLLAQRFSVGLLPWYLLGACGLTVWSYELLLRRRGSR